MREAEQMNPNDPYLDDVVDEVYPETHGKVLPNTVEENSRYEKHKWFIGERDSQCLAQR